jgi:hypothetical protein
MRDYIVIIAAASLVLLTAAVVPLTVMAGFGLGVAFSGDPNPPWWTHGRFLLIAPFVFVAVLWIIFFWITHATRPRSNASTAKK